MQSVPDGLDIPSPKGKFQVNWKLVFILFTIIILLALVMVPVRTDYTIPHYQFDIKLTPSFTDEYYIYFPFYIVEEPAGIRVREFEGDGAFDLITTEYGTTLNISGKGPITIDNGFFSFNRNIRDKIYSIKEGDFMIFFSNVSEENTLHVAFSSFILTGGTDYNIYGQKLWYWTGGGPSLWGNATFEEDGWQVFPNLNVR